MSIKGLTQEEIRDDIARRLDQASKLMAGVSNDLTMLQRDQGFISLAKVNADNLATMIGNLGTRIKYPTGD